MLREKGILLSLEYCFRDLQPMDSDPKLHCKTTADMHSRSPTCHALLMLVLLIVVVCL